MVINKNIKSPGNLKDRVVDQQQLDFHAFRNKRTQESIQQTIFHIEENIMKICILTFQKAIAQKSNLITWAVLV